MTLYNEVYHIKVSIIFVCFEMRERSSYEFFFRFETYLPMHDLWKEYMKQTLGLTDKSK